MDYRFAMAVLSGPLVFSDPLHIEARDLVARVQAARVRLCHCPACFGAGFKRRGRKARRALCRCIQHEPREVLAALGFAVSISN